MANPPSPVQHYTRIPDVLGAVRCRDGSDALERTGPAVEPLGDILIYLRQSATLIGEAFGLEELGDAHLQARNLSALCLARGPETLGLLLTPTARPADIIAKAATLRTET